MTKAQAYRILEVDQYTEQDEIKKKYRKLMHREHPDANMEKASTYLYTAQEINEAYALLRNQSNVQRTNKQKKRAKNPRPKQTQWDASLNQRAYTWRNVYHYAEDYDGEIMGDFVIASGKYLWKTEEDFPLFLKSMFECSQRLLQEIEAETETGWERSTSYKMKIQGELAYLLAQQFIDGAGTLEKQDRRNSRNPHRYKNLDFGLKIPLHQEETFPESINLQIEELLRAYYKEK